MARLALIVTASLLVAAPGLAGGAPARGPKRTRVAVLDIRSLGTELHKAELLSEILLTEMTRAKRYDVIGRSDVAALLGLEKQKAMLGCAEDAACLAEIGGSLGVDFIIVGSLGRIGTVARLDLKLLDARRSRVVERFGESIGGGEEQLVEVAQRGARALLEALAEQQMAAAPVEPVPPAESGAKGVAAPAPAATPASALTVAPPAIGAKVVAVTEGKVPAASPPDSRRRWAWIAGGSGLALVGAGVVAGLGASAALDDQRAAAAAANLPAFNDSRDKARSRALVADVLYGLGAVGVGTGVYLGLTSRGRPGVSAALVPLQGGVGLAAAGEF
jgi:TolB-like protein